MFWLFLLIMAVLGAAIGSFINAAVFRLYRDLPLVQARSRCVHCETTLVWYHLVPLVSFVMLGGVCGTCSKPIPSRYLLVESATAFLFAVCAWLWWRDAAFDVVRLLRYLFALGVLVFLFVYDYEYNLLPDIVTIPATVLIAAATLYVTGFAWLPLLIGVAFGAGFFSLQYLVSGGKWIGGGDIRFGALMGALLGWPLVVLGLFASYLGGSVVAIWLLATKRKQVGQTVPFGTFLAVGTLLALWFGQPIFDWYMNML